jgi:ornithine carbamoyltransferase
MRRFVDLADLSRDEVLNLLELARRLETRPEPHALAGKILGLLFMNPSLRTLASFQAGMARLGGTSFVITPGSGTWQLETRDGAVMDGAAAEHINEGLPVLASYCDALGIRSFAEGKDLAADVSEQKFNAMSRLVDKPLINLESAVSHPCQSLADWKTLDELGVPRGGKFVLSWAYHPRHGSGGTASRRFCSAAGADGQSAPGGSRIGRVGARKHRPQRRAQRRECRVRQGMGFHQPLRRRSRRRARPARTQGLVLHRELVCRYSQ